MQALPQPGPSGGELRPQMCMGVKCTSRELFSSAIKHVHCTCAFNCCIASLICSIVQKEMSSLRSWRSTSCSRLLHDSRV